MSALVLAIRPRAGCDATVEAGRAVGLTIEGCPLSEIRPLAWQPPLPDAIDGLLLGSANALRAAGPALEPFRGKPVYAVGEATARAAAAAGFSIAATGPGMLQALLDSLAGARLRLLRLTGAEHVQVNPPPGIEIEVRIGYHSAPLPLPEAVAGRLRGGGLILLHSAAAARHFAAECDRLGVPRARLALASLAPRIAAAAGQGWAASRAAARPHEAALLALAQEMCHDAPAG